MFLPLSYLKLLAADATVIDHFIFPAHRFRRLLNSAVSALTNHSDQLILLEVRPNTPETEYCWIQPAALVRNNGRNSPYQVESFIEKPTAFNAQQLMKTGGLWNTMILVGKLTTFWNLGWFVLPKLMQKFRAFQALIGTQWEQSMLKQIYVDMPVCNLSKDLLQNIPNHLSVLEMSNILWSDWGNPSRIAETLLAIGKTVNFVSDELNGFLSKPLGAPSLPVTQSS